MEEKDTAAGDLPEAKWRQEKKTRKPGSVHSILAIIVTVVLVALAVLAFLFRDQLSAEGLRGLFRGQRTAVVQSDAFTYEIGTGQVFTSAGNGLAVASSSAVELLNASGETVFKQVVSYGTPAAFACPSGALFCDLGGTGCVLAGMDGAGISLSPAGEIITASMNENGWFALVTDAVGYKALVSVYDGAGTLKFEWWSGAGYVLKALVSPDNRSLAVLCAESGGGKMHIFRLDSEEEQAATEFENELPFDLGFLGNDTLCAVSQDALSFLAADGRLKNRFELGENYLLDYDLGSQNFVAICVDAYRTGSGGMIGTLDKEGKVLGRKELTREVSCLSASGRQLLVMTAGSLAVYGLDMSVQYENEALMTAKKALLRPDGGILLLSAYSAEKLSY